jgi:hypothetical protein
MNSPPPDLLDWAAVVCDYLGRVADVLQQTPRPTAPLRFAQAWCQLEARLARAAGRNGACTRPAAGRCLPTLALQLPSGRRLGRLDAGAPFEAGSAYRY